MTKGCDELVKVGINSWATYAVHFSLWLTPICRHASDDFRVCLTDERVEEVVQRIFADCLELMGMLVVARLRAVVDMALTRGPAGSSLRFALYTAAAVTEGWGKPSACEAIRNTRAGCYAVRREGRRYGILRHDCSIEAWDDLCLLAEWAGGRRVHEARVA